jgi:hypothetical protein
MRTFTICTVYKVVSKTSRTWWKTNENNVPNFGPSTRKEPRCAETTNLFVKILGKRCVQGRTLCFDPVNTVMSTFEAEYFLASVMTIDYSRPALLHGVSSLSSDIPFLYQS